ncbi:hypothetical protein [Siphonobacter aquaeclarae]|uniref:Cytochrome b561 n=1 Tax=Siphonobacter aquaeclarae TaxID=563176 RepID=A0A1G9K100_9BACT|nr:hypothetical protein [Siphonobacter aquaeclarae]SDL42995.1 hypothetical protein SAMN04488090_0822 [Siphonobacter aquaeclarae]
MKYIFLLAAACLLPFCGIAQTEPGRAQPDSSGDDLLKTLVDTASRPALLPPKMIVTQRLLWGSKGFMRTTGMAPLTPEGRAHELKIRRSMLVSHQVAGFVTLAGFIAQGIVGAKLYNATGSEYSRLKSTHETIGTAVNITYTTTALLSLFAPPRMVSERRGFSSIKLHKYLAVVHIAGMIATNVLASSLEGHPELKPYHRAAAYTTFGAFAASVIAIKF